MKVVFRGLPTSTPKEAIASTVEAEGFHVIKIDQLTRRGNYKKLPLFYMQVEPCENISDIYEMTEVLGTTVKVVPHEGRKGLYQCYCCQGFWHSSAVCRLPVRCVKCTGEDSSADCDARAFRFENCGGNHAGYWRGCPQTPQIKAKSPRSPKKKPQDQSQVSQFAGQNYSSVQFLHCEGKSHFYLGKCCCRKNLGETCTLSRHPNHIR